MRDYLIMTFANNPATSPFRQAADGYVILMWRARGAATVGDQFFEHRVQLRNAFRLLSSQILCFPDVGGQVV